LGSTFPLTWTISSSSKHRTTWKSNEETNGSKLILQCKKPLAYYVFQVLTDNMWGSTTRRQGPSPINDSRAMKQKLSSNVQTLYNILTEGKGRELWWCQLANKRIPTKRVCSRMFKHCKTA
jgi:hypothetical protein